MGMILRIGLVLACGAACVFGQARDYGRSMVITQQGMAATSHTLASQAGAQILAKGGSAVDAAIAANAVLGVVEPMMDGIGGDLFAIYYDAKSGKLTGLNASGPAPRGLSAESLTRQGHKTMPNGIQSVTVPGAVDGWAKMHERFGKLPWKELFQAAIAYAEEGFPVTEDAQRYWSTSVAELRTQPETSRVYLPEGRAPHVGEVFKNPEMGRALRIIAENGAEKGRDAFYKGEIATAILKTSRSLGGTMTAEDLANFSAEWVEPISTDYRGWKVFELPPNGQGIAALEMLNIMDTMPAGKNGPYTGDELHRRIESMKLAYSDLRYNGDPRFADIPVRGLLAKDYARKRAASIDPAKANCAVAPGAPTFGETTYLTTVDKDGNIVSWIQSLYDYFGSGVTVESLGFLLHNRGQNFTLTPGSPNVLAGGKRPSHTIIPGFMEKGDLHAGFGIMGGFNQPLAHAQFVSNIVDYGMNVQAALEAPRFTKRNATGCEISIEMRVPGQTLQALSERGHVIAIRREYTQEMGRGQAILHDSKTGVNYAASDPRADGSAVPEPIR